MHVLDSLCDIFESELKEIAKKPEINQSDLNVAGELLDGLKDIETIKAMKDASYNGYSNRAPYMYEDYGNSYGNYGRGMYARGNSYGMRDRDGDGRYNENGYSQMDPREKFARDMDQMRQGYNGMN